MPITRRELIRRLSALSSAGMAGLLPTRALSTHAGEDVTGPRIAPLPKQGGAAAPLNAPALPVWDGISGGTGVMFNKGAVLPWENTGGDWYDADGVVQGPKPLAIMALPKVGPQLVDLSAFVDKLGSGIMLRGHGAVKIGSRYNANVADRPTLICDGVEVVCTAASPLAIGSTTPQAVADPTFGDGANMMLQFDIPAGTKNASLRITVTKWYTGTHSADVFLLRAPRLFTGGAAQLGIADKYDHDSGIASDPAVYFATKFDDDWIKTLFPEGGIIAPAVIATDQGLGIPALSSHYKIGEVGCMWYDHKWSSRDPNMRPGTTDPTLPVDKLRLNNPLTPDELYFRLYLKLGPGYQCAVQGKKLPGLAWRYGFWNYEGAGGGYYYPMCGNGGAKSTGLRQLDSAGRDILCGGSMRHLAHEGSRDANPLDPLIVLGYYAYHAEMKDFYGDFWRWGDAQRGYVNIEQGRWYCVEHRVKMNSIDLSAPDAYGNGVGRKDGIVQGWLDGVLVFDKRDVVLRNHPAIKVDEVWLTHYHGGLDPAEVEHPYAMAALVVAKQYIGPMGGLATPVIAPTVPGTATVISNPYGPLQVTGAAFDGSTISNFSGNTVLQLGSVAGAPGSVAEIDFQSLDIGAGNALVIRSGATGQSVVIANAGAAATTIAGTLVAQGGNGAPPPFLYVRNSKGISVTASGSITALSGLGVDTLGATWMTGEALANRGVIDGGVNLELVAGRVNGGGQFKGDGVTIRTFGSANNPVNGAYYLQNGLQLYPSSGGTIALTLNAYGSAPQVLNLFVNGSASAWMPSAWPAGVSAPANNAVVSMGGVRPSGAPEPTYGGGSMILQATGSLTLVNGGTNDFVFPGAIVLKALGDLNLNAVVVNQGWTTSGQPFQGIFFESPNIVSPNGNIQVFSNDLNWMNFSTFPHAPVRAFSLKRNSDGSASFATTDATTPHLNTYSVIQNAAASGGCWTCAVNAQPVNMY